MPFFYPYKVKRYFQGAEIITYGVHIGPFNFRFFSKAKVKNKDVWNLYMEQIKANPANDKRRTE